MISPRHKHCDVLNSPLKFNLLLGSCVKTFCTIHEIKHNVGWAKTTEVVRG